MFKDYYQEELTYLHDLGRDFAKAYPDLGPFLSQPGSDPDVERLLEGVAFLTGRLRQKLDDELPELTHELVETFFPHYLRPVPAMTVMRFAPLQANHAGLLRVPAGASIDAVPVEGTTCRFRTTSPVELLPLDLTSTTLETGAHHRLVLTFRLREGVDWAKLKCDKVRLHLAGEPQSARQLLLALVQSQDGQLTVDGRRVGSIRFAQTGFAREEALLPHPANAPDAYRCLLEYFTFPEKYLFIELSGLAALTACPGAKQAVVSATVDRNSQHLAGVDPDQILLGCTPAVNLFRHDADPLLVDHRRHEYQVIPTGGQPTHYEVFAIDQVEGRIQGGGGARSYKRLLHMARNHDHGQGFFVERHRPAVAGRGADIHLSFINAGGAQQANEVVSLTLTCTNRQLPDQLKPGDIRLSTPDLPQGVTARNLIKPRSAISPILDGDLHWRLLGHLNLGCGSVLTADALRALIELYDLRYQASLADRDAGGSAHAVLNHQRLKEGIETVRSQPTTRLMEGVPVRGLDITVVVDEERVGGSGDAYLLGAVLDEFLAQFITLNSFSRLTVSCRNSGSSFAFPARLGRRRLV